jgi:hypothetical protein
MVVLAVVADITVELVVVIILGIHGALIHLCLLLVAVVRDIVNQDL